METKTIQPTEEEIKKALSSHSRDPLDTIQSIQKDYGLDLPGVDAIYLLLRLSGCNRLEIHQACLDALNQAVIARIEQTDFQLEHFYDIFKRTFPYIHIPDMQPIPMALLKKFERHIDDESIFEKLKLAPDVFEKCPLNVKQRVWKQDETFFQRQMLAILNDYHHDERLQELAMNLKPFSYLKVIEERRDHPIVHRIIDSIGNDSTLYTMFMDMIRIVFETTPYPSLCSLRVDILMNFHDKDVSEIYSKDKCHRLIWSLDACVRNQNMDDAIIGKIKECFDDVKNGTPLYGDFAMVLMDPIISNFLASSIVGWLRNSVDEGAPKNLEELINYNAKLLNLAEHAPLTIAKNVKIPKLDKEIKTSYWNAVCSIVADEDQTIPTVFTDEHAQVVERMLVRSEIARKVFVHYVLDRVHENDLATLTRTLPYVFNSMPSKDESDDEGKIQHIYTYRSFCKTLVGILATQHLVKCVMDLQWRAIVMEDFLLKLVAWDFSVHECVVKMLAEYFLKRESIADLGDQVDVIETWANHCLLHGYKEEKYLDNLRHEYTVLLVRSAKMGDRFQIMSPAIVSFCSEHQKDD